MILGLSATVGSKERSGRSSACEGELGSSASWRAPSLDFQTWYTLVRQQAFEDDEVIELMAGMVRCLLMRT